MKLTDPVLSRRNEKTKQLERMTGGSGGGGGGGAGIESPRVQPQKEKAKAKANDGKRQSKQERKQTMREDATRHYEVKRSIRAAGGISRGGPRTPVPSWKLYDNPFYQNQYQTQFEFASAATTTTTPRMVSARRLAASLWEFHPQQEQKCEHTLSNRIQTHSINCRHSLQNGSLMQTSLTFPDKLAQMDSPMDLDELFRAYNRIQSLEEEQSDNMLLVQSLQAELELARMQVQEMEFEQKTCRKEMERLLRKIGEERTLWRNREQERIKAAIQIAREELESERKSRRRTEILNRKLAKELGEAKMDMLKSMKGLDNERKAREVMEDVCEELAKEIGEDKAKAEDLRQEAAKYKEELEEERRMLQMAEVLREERVQMKFEEARLFLEEKYLDLENLKSDLEGFLESMRGSKVDDVVAHMRGAQLLRNVANFIRVDDIKELSCQPAAIDDPSSGDEEFHSIEISNEAMNIGSTRIFFPRTTLDNSASYAINCQTLNPAFQSTSISPKQNYSKANIIENERETQDEERDFVAGEGSSGEEGSSNSYQETEDGREMLNDSHRENRKSYGNESDEIILQAESYEDDIGSAILITKQEICFDTKDQLRKENSPTTHFPRSSPGKDEFCKQNSMQDRFPTPIKYSSFSRQSVNGANSPYKNGLKSTPDTGNPHIARGIKGFIEWPKGIRHNSLKAKLLEAKVESQRAQIRHVLKPKHLKTEIGRS